MTQDVAEHSIITAPPVPAHVAWEGGAQSGLHPTPAQWAARQQSSPQERPPLCGCALRDPIATLEAWRRWLLRSGLAVALLLAGGLVLAGVAVVRGAIDASLLLLPGILLVVLLFGVVMLLERRMPPRHDPAA